MNSVARKRDYPDFDVEGLSDNKSLIRNGREFHKSHESGIIHAVLDKIGERQYASYLRIIADLPNDLKNVAEHAGIDFTSQAVKDAATFLGRLSSTQHRRLEITDDRAVVIHWRSSCVGLLVVVTGDGTATYSIKRPGGSYGTNGVEIDLSRRIPGEVVVAIEEIERDASAL